MKRFRFPLRSVSVLRAHQELRAREVFAATVHTYVQAEEARASARARTAAAEQALTTGRLGAFRASEAANFLADYRRECAVEMEAERAVIAARAAMEQRRLDYIEAHRKVQALQRLEEKARVSHRQEANRIEQSEFDDFAGRRSARRTTCSR